MNFQPVFLTTDILIYVLLTAIIWFGVYASRHDHLSAPWRQVARRPMAMAALVVLLAYVAIGLMDSLHFRLKQEGQGIAPNAYSGEVMSLLDYVAMPLRVRVERTYSAPFAAQAYTMETVEHPDGRRTREYPRLQFAGTHLQGLDGRSADIGRHVLAATFSGLALCLLLVLAFLFSWRKRDESLLLSGRRLWRGVGHVPWRTILVAVGVLIVLAANAICLSTYYHILGTDQVGQDVLFKSLKSIRTGLVIGTLTTLIMLPFAALFGIMAGYFRGWIDDVIQYTYTTLSSIPGVLLIAAAILSLQVYVANHPETFDSATSRADIRLLFLCLILGVTSWTSLCRLLRGETLKLREVDYIQAARALGASHVSIMTRHILPNVMHIIL
ncbi:MAG: ABC transporter permease, partial [Pseudomonadota bacterium]